MNINVLLTTTVHVHVIILNQIALNVAYDVSNVYEVADIELLYHNIIVDNFYGFKLTSLGAWHCCSHALTILFVTKPYP